MAQDDKLSYGAVVSRELAVVWRFFCTRISRATRGTLWQAWRGRSVEATEQSSSEGAAAAEAATAESRAESNMGAPAVSTASVATEGAIDHTAAVIDKLEHRFAAKLDARERRQQQLQRQRERDERQEALIDPRLQPDLPSAPASEQLELGLETLSAPAAAVRQAASALPLPVSAGPYELPPIDLLLSDQVVATVDEGEIAAQRKLIQDCLDSFGIDADVGDAICGPRVTLYQVNVAQGVRVSVVSAIAKDLCMALSAPSLRILAPVPGHDYVGIEVPNRRAQVIRCGGILGSSAWKNDHGRLPVIMGRNIQGEDVFLDLSKAPHLLVAGATGSGKSVCLNAILMSLLYRYSPSELRLILVDPKVVEMNVYARLPHLVVPVITDVQLVVMALRWLIHEMERRYRVLAKVGVRNLDSFNGRPASTVPVLDDEGGVIPGKLPYIVLVIDELADIMLSSRTDVESGLARIAQMSRAVGIHTIVATQRPSVNVITGVIKANFPTRVAFQVSSQVDSRTIIDGKGAESLLGAGDMLFKPPTASRIQRLQGAMVTDPELERVVAFCAAQGEAAETFEIIQQHAASAGGEDSEDGEGADGDAGDDENESLVRAAMEIVIRDHKASISYVQRRLRIGYNRAATLIDTLEKRGVIGPQLGTAPREILVDSMEDAVGDEDY